MTYKNERKVFSQHTVFYRPFFFSKNGTGIVIEPSILRVYCLLLSLYTLSCGMMPERESVSKTADYFFISKTFFLSFSKFAFNVSGSERIF